MISDFLINIFLYMKIYFVTQNYYSYNFIYIISLSLLIKIQDNSDIKL